MIGLRPLLAFMAACAAMLMTASAQVQVQISLPTTNYVAGEEIPVTVTITNYAGKDLTFLGSTTQNWLEFNVMSGNQPVSPAIQAAIKGAKIKAGGTGQLTFGLATIYGLQNMGNYSVEATVRLPGEASNGGAMSNRILFNVYTPRPFWTQKIGLGDGRQREFRVMNFSSGQKTLLYCQVVDDRTGGILRAQSLGESLTFKHPSIAVDDKQVMHVLYQINPAVWGHARIASDGGFNGRDLYKPAGMDPFLAKASTGAIVTQGAIAYDPKKEAEERAKVRKATDRPSLGFQ